MSLIGRIVSGGITIAYGILLARLLDVHSVGVVILGLTLIRIAEFLARFGLELGTIHFIAVANGEKNFTQFRAITRSASAIVLFGSTFVGAVVFMAAESLANVFNSPDLGKVIRLLAISLPFTSLSAIILAALLGLKQITLNTLGEKIIAPGLNLIMCGSLLLLGLDLNGAAIAYALAAALTLPLAWLFLVWSTPDPQEASSLITKTALLRFSLPTLGIMMANQFLIWTDSLLLGWLSTPSNVGIYGTAMRTSLLAGVIAGSFSAILAPSISDLHNRGEYSQLGATYKTVGKWTFQATLPVVALAFILADDVMALYGPAFASGNQVFIILVLSQLFSASTGSVGLMLIMSGRQRTMLINVVVALCINIILNVLLIPQYGMIGAAIAACIASLACNALALIEVQRLLKLHPFSKAYYKIFMVNTLPLVIVFVLKQHVFSLHYLTSLILYCAIYMVILAFAYRMVGLDPDDRVLIDAIRKQIPLLRKA